MVFRERASVLSIHFLGAGWSDYHNNDTDLLAFKVSQWVLSTLGIAVVFVFQVILTHPTWKANTTTVIDFPKVAVILSDIILGLHGAG
jgi:hypothetical protein